MKNCVHKWINVNDGTHVQRPDGKICVKCGLRIYSAYQRPNQIVKHKRPK